MKKIFFIIALCFVYTSNAQTLNYNDIGVLFTQEQINGTARYNSMSGAFGALGGDLSAIGNNPAGAAVFLKSEATFTIDFRGIDTQANYYGTNSFSTNENVNFSQSGGVFVYKNNSDWNKFAFAFDYSKVNDYENFWYAEGNSGFAPISDIYDNTPVVYMNSDGQYFENFTNGRNNKYSFTIASQYQDNIYVGASFNTYDIDYYQNALIEEYNNDGNGNIFDVSQIQKLLTYGNGYSFSLGLIAKPINSIRLGFSYQSPVWYTLVEEFVEYDVNIYENEFNITNEYPEEDTYSGVSRYYYDLRSPSRYTGSFAYVFGKYGLLSLDYTYKNYRNIQLGYGLNDENQAFKNNYNGVSAVRIGTEWRIDKLSLRGGYHFEQSPYKNSISSDDVDGYSLGLGYNFGKVKLDFAYLHSSNTGVYDFYPQYDELQATELDFKSNRYTLTLALNL